VKNLISRLDHSVWELVHAERNRQICKPEDHSTAQDEYEQAARDYVSILKEVICVVSPKK
jgi:hypothetical protein